MYKEWLKKAHDPFHPSSIVKLIFMYVKLYNTTEHRENCSDREYSVLRLTVSRWQLGSKWKHNFFHPLFYFIFFRCRRQNKWSRKIMLENICEKILEKSLNFLCLQYVFVWRFVMRFWRKYEKTRSHWWRWWQKYDKQRVKFPETCNIKFMFATVFWKMLCLRFSSFPASLTTVTVVVIIVELQNWKNNIIQSADIKFDEIASNARGNLRHLSLIIM